MSGDSHAGNGATHSHGKQNLAALMLGAVGVVFGDIGTSPLYTLKACLGAGEHAIDPRDVLGVLSLIFWALMLVVTVKYLVFIMRADNRGEGGILALLALVPDRVRTGKHGVSIAAGLVVAGAALLYGDGMITPAISVLSALEGVDEATTAFRPYVIPATCVILFALFLIQSRGTGAVGFIFGPIMILWFTTIGVLGLWHTLAHPRVFEALNPLHAAGFFHRHGLGGAAILGSVVLAVTGGEALYADMGHFGARPIRLSWMVLVLPALVLCYFGQGALVLSNPDAARDPFFSMVPHGTWTYALVVLSTAATIIASQALISGAFSLTHQAVQLGYFPRVTVKHTSRESEGQIYVPEINWLLAVACIALVIAFKKSDNLASAYGLAVTGTMGITSIIFFVVTHTTWKWPLWKSVPLLLLFLSFDIPFFLANALKFVDGGYVPVAVGVIFFIAMMVWKRGRTLLSELLRESSPPVDSFFADVRARVGRQELTKLDGAGIFLSSSKEGVPPVLEQHVRRLRAIPVQVVLLTIVTEHDPVAREENRLEVLTPCEDVYRVIARYGFTEHPDVPHVLRMAKESGKLPIDLQRATYFLGRETFLATQKGKMGAWTESIFALLARNARPATAYFSIPHEQVVELGSQIDL